MANVLKPVSCKGHRLRVKLWFEDTPIAIYDKIDSILIIEEPVKMGFTARQGKSGTLKFTAIDGDEFTYICNGSSNHECRIEEKLNGEWVLLWNSGNK